MLNFHLRQKYTLGWDKEIARELGGYGAKVAANSLLEHFRGQSLLFVLSKLNGPADVGHYNRASSLAGMPMQIVGSAPYQAIFRALVAEQDNLDKSRYIYYRTVTLVTTYTLPFYVLAWWLAEPGIRFIYGDKWLAAAAPLAILATSGLFRCLSNTSGAVIEARNRLATEIKLNIVSWVLLIAGMFYGLRWGLTGLAWVVVVTSGLFSVGLATVAGRELMGSSSLLFRAIAPALILNTLLLAVLWVLDLLFMKAYENRHPGLYATVMTMIGGVGYAATFLFLPIKGLESEAAKWRNKLRVN
jgi:O-antigen/teichoic acid export membrane protein